MVSRAAAISFIFLFFLFFGKKILKFLGKKKKKVVPILQLYPSQVPEWSDSEEPAEKVTGDLPVIT